MGTNNRQRRAASKRRKQRAAANRQRRTASPPGSSTDERRPPPQSPRGVSPGELLAAVIDGWDDRDRSHLEPLMCELLADPASAIAVTEASVQRSLEQLWSSGWTPADIIHVIDREQGRRHASVAAEQIAADGARRRDGRQALHPRWRDQLAALREWQTAASDPMAEEHLHDLVDVLCLLVRLPDVPRTVPAPGATWRAAASEPHLDARMLAKVRALLAKAESTDFDDEAEAFTAKAQELIARHAIDEALLHTVDDIGEPSVRRMLIDDPYAEAKSRLIARVADANRCRAVYTPGLAWSTVFGYDHDLDAVELLTASLLTQATAAMVRHGSRRDAAGRSRTRSFRRSFLLGFADRIGERLQEATATQVSATVDEGGQLVPVLAARDDQLRKAQRAAFPHLEHRVTSVGNATGWHAGQAAAELADLHAPRDHIT